MCMKETLALTTGLLLLATAPAFAESGINCRVVSEPGIVVRGQVYTEAVTCEPGLVLTGGGQSCQDAALSTVHLPSNTTPAGPNWVCSWENDTLENADCRCHAVCCTMTADVAVPLVCDHDECLVGPALDAGPPEQDLACSECVAEVCDCDPYCCTTNWDTFCIHEAQELCDKPCDSTATCISECACANPIGTTPQ